MPFCEAKTLGSTETVITAGVTPLEGEIVMPLVFVETVNGVLSAARIGDA